MEDFGNFDDRTKLIEKERLWKTSVCRNYQQGFCPQGLACQYAHGLEELRPRPDLSKTRLCPRLSASNTCELEEAGCCPFAHHPAELRLVEATYKTKLCKYVSFPDGCRMGLHCRYAKEELYVRYGGEADKEQKGFPFRFAHTMNELRPASENFPPPPIDQFMPHQGDAERFSFGPLPPQVPNFHLSSQFHPFQEEGGGLHFPSPQLEYGDYYPCDASSVPLDPTALQHVQGHPSIEALPPSDIGLFNQFYPPCPSSLPPMCPPFLREERINSGSTLGSTLQTDDQKTLKISKPLSLGQPESGVKGNWGHFSPEDYYVEAMPTKSSEATKAVLPGMFSPPPAAGSPSPSPLGTLEEYLEFSGLAEGPPLEDVEQVLTVLKGINELFD